MSYFEGKGILEEDVWGALETIPFMDDHRVVVVKEVMAFLQETADSGKGFLKRIEKLPPGVVLIFTEEQIPIDGRLSFIKKIKKMGGVEFKPLSPPEFRNFILSELEHRGKRMNSGTLQFFIETTRYFHKKADTNLYEVQNELRKIMDSTTGPEVTRREVEEGYNLVSDQNIFDFIDRFSVGDTQGALSSYHELLDGNAEVFQIFAMIQRQVRLLLRTKILMGKGYQEGEAAKIMGTHSFVTKKLFSEQRRFSEDFLREFYDYLARTDIRLKTGSLPPAEVLEQVILKFTKRSI